MLDCLAMQDEPEKPYTPPKSPDSTPFPAGRFWSVGLLPTLISAAGGLLGNAEVGLIAALTILPCAAIVCIIFSRYRRKCGKPELASTALVLVGMVIFNGLAAIFGCSTTILHGPLH